MTHLRLIIVKQQQKHPHPCNTAPRALLSHVETQDEKQCQRQTWENWRAGLSNHDLSGVRTEERSTMGDFDSFRGGCSAKHTQKGTIKGRMPKYQENIHSHISFHQRNVI